MPENNPALAPIPAAPAEPAGPPNTDDGGGGGGAPDAKPAAASPTAPAEGEAKPAAGLIPKPDATGNEPKPEGDAKTADPAEKPSVASGLAEGFGSEKKTPEGDGKPKADATGEGKGEPEPIAITLPAGTIVPDQAAMDAFAAFAGGAEMTTPLTSEQASELAAYQIQAMDRAAAVGRVEWVKKAQATNQTWEKELLEDPDIGGGDPKKYQEATAIAQKGFRRFAGEGVANYLIDLSGGEKDWHAGESVNLTLQPDLFKMFHDLGKALGEDTASDVGGGNAAPDGSQNFSSIYNHPSSRQAASRLANKGG